MPLSKAEREFHRKTAARCFNEAWTLLEKPRRSRGDDLRLLGLAHASRFHWGLVGTAEAQAVGDWQLSRVYADLRSPDLALRYARSCLDLCEQHHLRQFLGTADEALARAYAVARNFPAADRHLARARRRLAEAPIDREDRAVFDSQIRDTERWIRRLAGRG